MALLKNEMFPTGTLLGGDREHVSLIETVMWQASREKDAGLLDLGSGFWRTVRIWVCDDPVLVVGGSLAMAAALALVRWYRHAAIIAGLSLVSWLFLARGGVVNDHFLVPLLPFLALNLALLVTAGVQRVQPLLNRTAQLVPRHLLFDGRDG